VRGPLLLPSDYIRKYFFYICIELGYLFSNLRFVLVFETGVLCYSCGSGAV
jgi:hypothetical protein